MWQGIGLQGVAGAFPIWPHLAGKLTLGLRRPGGGEGIRQVLAKELP
jgi:hypothetical protein